MSSFAGLKQIRSGPAAVAAADRCLTLLKSLPAAVALLRRQARSLVPGSSLRSTRAVWGEAQGIREASKRE